MIEVIETYRNHSLVKFGDSGKSKYAIRRTRTGLLGKEKVDFVSMNFNGTNIYFGELTAGYTFTDSAIVARERFDCVKLNDRNYELKLPR